MKNREHLKIVAYDPNDYSLGSTLIKENRDEIASSEGISAALSLLFQFHDSADCSLVSPELGSTTISMSYDREERFISELYVDIQRSDRTFVIGQRVGVRFEIFRQCYEFLSEVLAFTPEDKKLIITPPTKILAIKHRRLPRIAISEEQSVIMPSCLARCLNDSVAPVKLLEIGLTAIRISSVDIPFDQIKSIEFREHTLPIELLRVDNGGSAVYKLCPLDSLQYGAAFDLYRLVAYPHLRRRDEFSPESLLDLYAEKTKYIEKFQTAADNNERGQQLKEIWRDLAADMHRITADYVTVDADGVLAGASSTTLGFVRDGVPTWVFHQLCARIDPTLLSHSGELYTWRAEYLAGQPDNLEVIAWFDSKSRWLERIYVKFCQQQKTCTQLIPVSVARHRFRQDGTGSEIATRRVSFGKSTRHYGSSPNVFGAMDPAFLNAAGILDALVAPNDDAKIDEIQAMASALLASKNCNESVMEVSLSVNQKELFDSSEILVDVDRLCIFGKSTLVDFISSVEHSVAVTEKKKLKGDHLAVG